MRVPRATIVHAGRRDQYQLAIAFYQAGLLECLVTDVFFTSLKSLTARVATVAGMNPERRASEQLSGAAVKTSTLAGLANLAGSGVFPRSSLINDFKGSRLSSIAQDAGSNDKSIVFAYSHTGMGEMLFRRRQLGMQNILFEMHPHPILLREIYQEELRFNSLGRMSLNTELELQWSDKRIARESREAHSADLIYVASSFTKKSLVHAGIDEKRICVVPYGVGEPFTNRSDARRSIAGPLRILFVGSLIQRKGLSYLLAATRKYPAKRLILTLATRDYEDSELLRDYKGDNLEIIRGLPDRDLAHYMRQCDLFALPSLAEGFGHVILEAMACGLPVLATAHTCAADLVEDNVEGFVVPVRSVEAIAERIDWALGNRTLLAEMGQNARIKALGHSWDRFRRNAVGAYVEMF